MRYNYIKYKKINSNLDSIIKQNNLIFTLNILKASISKKIHQLCLFQNYLE